MQEPLSIRISSSGNTAATHSLTGASLPGCQTERPRALTDVGTGGWAGSRPVPSRPWHATATRRLVTERDRQVDRGQGVRRTMNVMACVTSSAGTQKAGIQYAGPMDAAAS